jgi:F0F1-type ATP synthase membrane subunit b/b'
MSAMERARKSQSETIKSTEEFIESTKKSLQRELSKTTPKIEHALDRSVDEAGQALSNALMGIEKKTSHEQIELLNGYRAFLQGQVAFVDKRIKAIKNE